MQQQSYADDDEDYSRGMVGGDGDCWNQLLLVVVIQKQKLVVVVAVGSDDEVVVVHLLLVGAGAG